MGAEAGLSRRGFLGIAASASALGLVGAGLWVAQGASADGYPASRHAVFSHRVQAVLVRLGAIWLPANGNGFPDPADLPWLSSLAAAWGRMPAHLSRTVTQATEAFDVAALLYGWHAQPFARLRDDEAHAYVERWSQGVAAQRSLIAAYRQLIHLAYWRHPQSWQACGYPGPLFQRSNLPALGDAEMPGA